MSDFFIIEAFLYSKLGENVCYKLCAVKIQKNWKGVELSFTNKEMKKM